MCETYLFKKNSFFHSNLLKNNLNYIKSYIKIKFLFNKNRKIYIIINGDILNIFPRNYMIQKYEYLVQFLRCYLTRVLSALEIKSEFDIHINTLTLRKQR